MLRQLGISLIVLSGHSSDFLGAPCGCRRNRAGVNRALSLPSLGPSGFHPSLSYASAGARHGSLEMGTTVVLFQGSVSQQIVFSGHLDNRTLGPPLTL